MVSKMNMLVLMVFLGAAIQCCGAQTTHVVGDSLGWVNPIGSPMAYSTWAGNKTFVVGDTLVFNFLTGIHDVAKVTKAAFDSCNSTSPMSLMTIGPATIALNQSGEHFFICTIGQHCSQGQKVGLNVSAAATPSPSPAATPSSPAPATTPPPSSPSPATPPSSAATPSPAATPSSPAPATTPPPSPATPPSSTATPPSTSTSPPPPSTTTTPPPAGSTTPPPEGNSAASLSVTGLFSGILSIALALLY